jgi:hypothetical protein
MSTASLRIAPAERRPVSLVLRAGLLAGTLDLCLATGIQVLVTHRINVPRILQAIAAGVLGGSSFEMGARSAVLGAVLHYLIATIWAAIFLVLVRRIDRLPRMMASARGLVTTGLAYGVVVWAGMRFVVVPLSRAASAQGFTWVTALTVAGHAALVGLPIVLVLWSGYSRRSASIGSSTEARRAG